MIAAAEMLAPDWNVGSEVHSVTSFSELSRQAAEVERWNRLHPQATRREPRRAAAPRARPVIAATDYVRAYPQLIAPYVEARFVALGTDGFGRSDTRAQLRGFFEVDRRHIALAALQALVEEGTLQRPTLAEAIKRYGVDRTHRRRGRAESGAALTKGSSPSLALTKPSAERTSGPGASFRRDRLNVANRRIAGLADHGPGRFSFGGFAVIQIKPEGGPVAAPHGRL